MIGAWGLLNEERHETEGRLYQLYYNDSVRRRDRFAQVRPSPPDAPQSGPRMLHVHIESVKGGLSRERASQAPVHAKSTNKSAMTACYGVLPES